jgi:hypothetical protein
MRRSIFSTVVLSAIASASLQTMQAQIAIPASLAAPPGSINTDAPGFKVRVFKVTGVQVNHVDIAESLIKGVRIDPNTGEPYINEAEDPGPIDITTVINWDGNLGPDSTAAGNFRNDTFFPGVPPSSDDYIHEITGFIQLPAGNHRLGVNSDDGFKLTIGAGVNPYDGFAVRLPGIDTTRGQANTDTAINIAQAGIYPFRLLYWERSGDARLEFSNFTPGTTTGGTRYLVNDSAQANAFKTFREPLVPFDKPYAVLIDPAPSSTGAPAAPFVRVDLQEQAVTVDTATAKIAIDGTELATTATRSGNVVKVSAQGPTYPANSVHTATLTYRDSAGNDVATSWQFTVDNYPTIPASYAATGVDTTKPGFKARFYQIPHARGPLAQGFDGNSTAQAERQIARGYISPDTGLPYENQLDTSAFDANGFVSIPNVINLSQAAGLGTDFGNFQDDSPTPMPDAEIPGVAGSISPAPSDNIVGEFYGYIQLTAGPHRLGVNSDDGFKLSVGRSPGDVNGIMLDQFNGGRGSSDSYIDFLVEADGYYPMRLIWWEGGSDANVEFFHVDLATGNKTLINDTASPFKVYQEASTTYPYASRVLPAANSQLVLPTENILVEISDGTVPVDTGSVKLFLNGVETGAVTKNGNVTTALRTGGVANLLGQGTNIVQLVYGFTSGGSQTLVTNEWSFRVGGSINAQDQGGGAVPVGAGPAQPISYVVIPPANKVAAGSASGEGFKILKVHQLDRSLDANQGNGGRYSGNGGNANRMPRPEIQLTEGYIDRTTDLPFPNLADLSFFASDGSLIVDGVFDFGQLGANAGSFNPTTQMPGTPGQGTSTAGAEVGTDNIAMEFITYMDLKAGAYLMSINSDDGFVLSSAPNPQDTLGTLIGYFNDGGGSQNPPGRWVSFVVLEDGIYPFRTVYWEGGGGANIEWMSIDPGSGQRALINSPDVLWSVKSYHTYTGVERPYTKFSVYPMPARWENQHQQSGPGPIKVEVGAGNPADIANDSPGIRPFGDSVGAIFANLGSGTVDMIVDGQDVTPTVSDIPGSTDKLVTYTPPMPFEAGTLHTAGLVYSNTTNYWTFTVITNVALEAGIAIPSSNADQAARGFRAKVVQASAARPGGNTAQAAENQLAGSVPNVAEPGSEPDGSHLVSGIINWNTAFTPGVSANPGHTGNFQPLLDGSNDTAIPGITGAGLSGDARFGNIAAEVFAYLDLPAGYQKFGVNGDDGWKVQIGTPGQTEGPVLFSIDRGAGNRDIPFAFVTPTAGLYPVRLVWYQGGGGGNLEFFPYGPGNRKIPVNSTDPLAVKAYYNVTGGGGGDTVITIGRASNGDITITWTNGGMLESSPALGAGANWSQLNDTGSYSAPIGAGPVFYRVRK